MHRTRSEAWTFAHQPNLQTIQDTPGVQPTRTAAPEHLRPANRVSSFKQERQLKQPVRPAQTPHQATKPTTIHNAAEPTSVSNTSSNTSSNTLEHGEKATSSEPANPKPGIGQRMKAGSIRFVNHTKDALFHSYLNVLLVFVPIGIALNYVPIQPEATHATIVFSLNAIAIIPLAGLLSHATESVASRMGDTWASLLNVTFGNAVELIIFIIALIKNEIAIVQASILGSILANLLLILGMAFLLGGLRYQEQIYNSTVTQMSACLLSLAVMSLLLPTAFHASFANEDEANRQTIKISRGVSVVLLLVYGLYLLFQLKSHAYMYQSTPQQIIDEETQPGFFADAFDSSSDDSSDSSSSSDSDSSLDSHTTRGKRFRKAISKRMRRKSSASSVQTGSVASILSSPTAGARSISSIPATPSESYFHTADRQRRGSHPASFTLPPVLSDNEAEYDGELDPNAPRVRDFEPQQQNLFGSYGNLQQQQSSVDKPKKHSDSKSKVKKYKHKIKKYKQQKAEKADKEREALPAQAEESVIGHEPQIAFVQPSYAMTEVAEGTTTQTQHSSLRRPFTGVKVPRPPLPMLFSNNVFVNPQYPAIGSQQPAGMSITRPGVGAVRRTNSLPNIKRDAQHAGGGNVAQPHAFGAVQRTGTPAINEADAIRKDQQEDGDKPQMSKTAAVMLLLISTGLVAFCAELMVDAIPLMIAGTSVSQAFIGLIILPIVGNAAEHVTAVTVAAKNKMDLAIGVAVGSSIQIALFITPVVVIIGWIADKPMSLYFNLFETVSLFVTAFVINFLILDGRSNYLEGSLLIASYVIIAVCAFFYPGVDAESAIGGGNGV